MQLYNSVSGYINNNLVTTILQPLYHFINTGWIWEDKNIDYPLVRPIPCNTAYNFLVLRTDSEQYLINRSQTTITYKIHTTDSNSCLYLL